MATRRTLKMKRWFQNLRVSPFIAGILFGFLCGWAVTLSFYPRMPQAFHIKQIKYKSNKDATTTLLDCCEALKEEKKKERKERRKKDTKQNAD